MTLRIKRSRTRSTTKLLSFPSIVLLSVTILWLFAWSPTLQSLSRISISADTVYGVMEVVDNALQGSYNSLSNYSSHDENITKTESDNHEKSSSSSTIVFVTASSQDHFEVALRDILKSLQYWIFGEASKQYDRYTFYFKANMTIHDLDIPFEVKVIFYDLDYEKKVMIEKEMILAQRYPFVEYRRFNYSAYPPHVNISTIDNGAYAWKPAIVKEVLKEQRQQLLQKGHKRGSNSRTNPLFRTKSLVYWADAGTVYLAHVCHLLNRDIEFALEYGLFTPENAFLDRWTLPDTAFHKLIQLDPELYRNQSTLMCSANTILVDATNDTIWDNVITVWSECAMDPSCIAPPGSNFRNHRYDQAVISALMAKNGIPAPNRQRRCIKRGTG